MIPMRRDDCGDSKLLSFKEKEVARRAHRAEERGRREGEARGREFRGQVLTERRREVFRVLTVNAQLLTDLGS